MLVVVLVQSVVRYQFGRMTVAEAAMIVAVIVDHDGGAVVADEAPTEPSGEQGRHEHVAGSPIGQDTSRHQEDTVGAAGL